ncbi:sugar transferase [Mycoplasmatota bacterium]|nr:sugar transferase [Mycoplasmatota bacterium]
MYYSIRHVRAISLKQELLKRSFDLTFSLIGIVLTFPIMLLAFLIASIETKSFGLFTQNRVGKDFVEFKIIKIKTMKKIRGFKTNVTTSLDPRITYSGRLFRKYKIDELPQLFNVLFGKMSFVGPRPDVVEMYDDLSGDDWLVLSIRPGITGPATIKYKNEEEILASVSNPEAYNKVIFKDKVNINLDYIKHYKFKQDIKYILKTFIGGIS